MPEARPRRYLGLCAIAKDETPFLREWAAYHHLIGFEHIFIYDNGSMTPVHETLRDMLDSGIVSVVYDLPGEDMQMAAYSHCLLNHGAECEWLAMLDLDEFLLLLDEDDARLLCSRYDDYSGLAVHRNLFGSAGHLGRPQGLVMENYCESIGFQTHVKSIGKTSKIAMCASPHDFEYKEGFAVNTDKAPAQGCFAPMADGVARVNHYEYRSQQDYEDKVRRGVAVVIDEYPERQIEQFYEQTLEPWQIENDILRHAPRVREIMASGLPAPYLPVDSREVLAEPYPQALSRLSSLLEAGKMQEARLVFGMARPRFKDKPVYLSLGEADLRL